MNYCKVYDCTSANNKCALCEHLNYCDYVWVAEIWKKNSELLTPLNPGWVKPSFNSNNIISYTGKEDFCIFLIPKKRDVVCVQDICVAESARGKGISKKIINYLMETFDRDVVAKCVKDSDAELFWSHIGVKIGEDKGKKRSVCEYLVKNTRKKLYKTQLF